MGCAFLLFRVYNEKRLCRVTHTFWGCLGWHWYITHKITKWFDYSCYLGYDIHVYPTFHYNLPKVVKWDAHSFCVGYITRWGCVEWHTLYEVAYDDVDRFRVL